MKRKELSFKQEVIRKLLSNKIDRREARRLLTCSQRTIRNYILTVTQNGLGALRDKRGGNHRKLSFKQEKELVQVKKDGSWRSARKALEITRINIIGTRQVQKVWVRHNLNRENVERLKPIQRFVAEHPNDLWQADIQGKIRFPFLGDAYLIATIDDHSRFILGGKWFSKQTQMNVFRVWYHCLFRWGLPKAMLQDKGTQYRANTKYGQTGEYAQSTYQFYAKSLGIDLIFAHKARTKGKIEKFWRFAQQDFAREYLGVRSFEELNTAFFKWQIKFNEEFRHSGIGMHQRTPAEVYQPSEKRRPKQELQDLLTITLRRFVYMDSTISLFGKRYKVPAGYIKCRIWLKLRGEKVSLEAMGRTILRFRLKV